jgi:ABC-type transport system involved in cytochrome bd biosynthesis fused ATPase/permease subunit
MSVLGEIPLEDGSVKIDGKISYVSQQPWVFSATLRQNIVFGNHYNASRYNKILKACALNKVTIIKMFYLIHLFICLQRFHLICSMIK